MKTAQFATIHPVTGFLVIFCASLIGASVLYGAFPSTGVFQNKEFQLGGAAAGFVAIFLLASQVFRSLQKQQAESLAKSQSSQIKTLEQELKALRREGLPDVICPDGFEVIVSKDYGIGFSKPRLWEPNTEQSIGLYMRPINSENIDPSFRGNINVTVTPLENRAGIPEKLSELSNEELKSPFIAAIQLYSGKSVEWNETYISNRRAVKVSFNFHPSYNPNATVFCEGAVVLDELSKQLFIFALYESELLISESKKYFHQLLSTISFVD